MDFLEEELEEILNIFREESEEQIQKLNQNLLKLEKMPQDKGVISELFREAHSIKGAARMIGMTGIQSLAHKLEDVIGFAKDGVLHIDAKIIDVLCTTVDCISSIVEESVKSKGEYHSPYIDEVLAQLKAIEDVAVGAVPSGQLKPPEPKKEEKKEEIQPEQSVDINKVFVESTAPDLYEVVFSLTSLKKNPSDSNAVTKLHKIFSKIDKEVQNVKDEDVKGYVFDIKTKFDWVIKGSGILIAPEVSDISELFDKFMFSFKELAASVGIDIPTFDAQSFNEIKNEDPVKEQEVEKNEDKEIRVVDEALDISIEAAIELNPPENEGEESIDSCVEYVTNNILSIGSDGDATQETSLKIIKSLNSIIDESTSKKAKVVYEKIREVVNYINSLRNKPEKDIIDVLRQSAQVAGNIILDPKKAVDEDHELIIQRLSILKQMLELSEEAVGDMPEPETKVSADEKEAVKEKQAVSASLKPVNANDLPEVKKNSEMVSKPSKVSEMPKPSGTGAIKTLRVDTRKLDQLINQVGELIVSKIKAQERLVEIERIGRDIEDWHREWNKTKQYIKYIDRKSIMENDSAASPQSKSIYALFDESSDKIVKFMNQMNTLYRTVQEDDARLNLVVNELEQMVKSVRVLPFATIFHMFPRMVRDISRSKGKKIELVVSGSETSADKKIIEEIKSPLTHIIRNAIDHGIETPEERQANGKNPTGKIFLSAYHLENSVLIEVIDDGRGIDLEKIKKKVLQKGLLSQAELEAMNENQIMNIVFWPGFSTGDAVTDISGRGIGLDVVHTKINQLNGKVNVKSDFGKGCKVSIQLPVTMATIKSFLVSVNSQTFAIPTSVIKTVSWVKPKDIFYKEGRKTIIVDNKTVPIYNLSNILEMPDCENEQKTDKVVVAVIQTEDIEVGFIIDKLIGEQEILHKNLSAPLIRVRNIAGVTTLGSGELCLILNVTDLIKSALSEGINTHMIDTKEHINNHADERKSKVLVVDDSVTTRILERNILKAAGYDVTVAINGLDALTKIAADSFDVVVSDVEMPEINGFELASRLKSDEQYKDIPLILVTSLASESDRKKGLNAGANAYITKGEFDQKELLKTVKKFLMKA